MSVKRILVFGMTENPGGVESFLMSYYRHIDRCCIQFDFLCNTHAQVAYEQEIRSLGGRIFKITPRREAPFRYRKELERVFCDYAGEWDAVWVNVCSLANVDYLKMARKYGVRKRIIHSHNSQNMDGRLRGFLHEWNKKSIPRIATDFWACSQEAAHWFYGDAIMPRVKVIRNAIEVERMAYDSEKREQMRKALGVRDEYVIGNVGRLHFQKNQIFALDVFNAFIKKYPDSKLIFVGQGPDEKALRQKCEKLGLAGSVVFAGVQSNVNAWLSAFDVFLFTSLFEGLGIALLEAQANGVPALASAEVIPPEAKINESLIFHSLNCDANSWAEQLATIRQEQKRIPMDRVYQNFVSRGYEISTEARKLERLLVR